MKLQLIRNATLKLDYAGHTVLVDPFLGPKHSLPSFAGRSPNPLVELLVDIDTILAGVELVIISHLHEDHFDDTAKERVPKGLPIFCQPGDEQAIRAAGFRDVTPLSDNASWQGLTLTRRDGSHGLGPVVQDMGPVIGFSLEAKGEPTVYWAGDTVFYPPVEKTIGDMRPDIVVTHSCGAKWNGDLIVMDAEQTIKVCETAKNSLVVATHMEALDHATVSRSELRAAADAHGIPLTKLVIPDDGEVLTLIPPVV
ncbi:MULTISPECIES: MBL fold metallo-hydrolase [unclassified Ensifer]|uniref:MBL fold metallo-hydrolase n=1 Tax=unclassified Ensifer TaxID=2633371 RepID=UPI000813A344|nr:MULTISPECIES: MBL fold metallo-hydrolase [unclassified Ensifer]OCO98953.1 Zn-dependent hydrolase [Ensifer sp. LC14]OCP11427.1 Zn-dependent hydrolase [Ensifer sp. LC13]OCP11931.1 Zn-dependent hydrolase [Ensifer sp. LC11]OCP33440.1 Zn-dependent hydrolase [Ensifer sp. LC499]